MEAYQREAQEVVAQAQAMRKHGKAVTYADFNEEINQRMKVYNATMRINRLELLKSQVGVHLTGATANIDSELQQKLGSDYISELKRQAGIMEVTATPSMWTGKKVAKIVMAQTGGANFNKRLWANQDALKARLDEVISTGIIQGQSPRKISQRLKSQVKDTVKNHRYVTERIARTESARVQYTAQIDSIKKNGYQFVRWFAESKACVTCSHIVHQDNGYGPGIYRIDKVPRIPDDTHPNCRCSISETWVEGEQNLALTDNERWAMNRYVSSDSYLLNEALRLGLTLNDDQKKEAQGIDSALKKLPLYTDGAPLKRSFTNAGNYDELANKIIQDGYYEDPAYVSTSKNIYDPDDVFRIVIQDSKTGHDVSSIHADEGEVLFPRNTCFRVVRYYKGKDGKPTIEVVEDGEK